jgi:L-alanine-DL-glutamate epimerase-like enolase superfamily enzyme
MRITNVEAIILRQPAVNGLISDGSQDDVVIRIETNEGVVGLAEVDSSPEMVKAAIDAPESHVIGSGLRALLLGEDPLDVDRLREKLYRRAIYFGRRGVGIHALSGVEIALWDIKGKALGVPVCRLLGEPRRDRVRAYASTLMPETTAAVEERVSELAAEGFTAIKLGWGPLGASAAQDIALIRAARRAAGEAVDLIIDVGLGYGGDVATARAVARACEELNIFCLEEPFGPDELSAYASLTRHASIAVSAGEQLTTLSEFASLIAEGGVDIVQPDVTRCGGLAEAVRIARYANERGVGFMPHAWKSGIIKAATLHVLAVAPAAPFLEYAVARTPINAGLARQRFPLVDGCVEVPTDPGLGIEIDPDALAQLRAAHVEPAALGR